jgi:glutaminyl-peptide cyclotransferase
MKTRFSSHLPTLLVFFVLSFSIVGCSGYAYTQTLTPTSVASPTAKQPQLFDTDRAYQDVLNQMDFGPRVPDSAAHKKEMDYITAELHGAGWQVEVQDTTYQGHPVKNITAYREKGIRPVILGAHYDSRMLADQDKDPDLRSQPVPGANDGASGVAVLLEIARVLPEADKNVWLVFFDSEDQGDIPGWDWILGSTVYAQSLTVSPKAVVVIDMIGDADLNIYRESSSNTALKDQIWQTAASLGYSQQFINTEKYNMEDDHTPFLMAGIPAIDIIDFDYPYWHTAEDTADKVSPKSLGVVGNVLLAWLSNQ